MNKICSKCKIEKKLDSFGILNSSKDGRKSHCKKCIEKYRLENKLNIKARDKKYFESNKMELLADMRENYKSSPRKYKNSVLKKKYGITYEEYEVLERQQEFKCKICGLPETSKNVKYGKTMSLAVDHCHKTNKIRGLLCGSCNTGLGKFKEDPELLKKALGYIEAFEKEQTNG